MTYDEKSALKFKYKKFLRVNTKTYCWVEMIDLRIRDEI